MALNFWKRGAFPVKGWIFKPLKILALLGFFYVGVHCGHTMQSQEPNQCSARKVSHTELEGCEVTAETVHNMLMQCEWRLESCIEKIEMYRESLFGR
jgi:hypothetical protein